jgi:hypothetical protein
VTLWKRKQPGGSEATLLLREFFLKGIDWNVPLAVWGLWISPVDALKKELERTKPY